MAWLGSLNMVTSSMQYPKNAGLFLNGYCDVALYTPQVRPGAIITCCPGA